MSFVQTEISDGVATVTLDDPDRRNALNAAMVDEIVATFDAIEADDDVGAVVVTGDGTGVLRRRRPVPPRRVAPSEGLRTSTRASCASAGRRCRPSPRSTAPPSAPA